MDFQLFTGGARAIPPTLSAFNAKRSNFHFWKFKTYVKLKLKVGTVQ